MTRRPLIISTDPGIDDAVAIALALFSDELEIKLICPISEMSVWHIQKPIQRNY
jgi:hypothetical protein